MNRAELHASLSDHFARYFDACDRKDLDAVMAFLAGAIVAAGPSEASDPAVIRSIYEERQPAPLDDGRRVTKHHVTNVLCDGPDADGAYLASAYYFRLQANSDGPYVATSGRLTQTLAPEGQRWRVLRHVITTDF